MQNKVLKKALCIALSMSMFISNMVVQADSDYNQGGGASGGGSGSIESSTGSEDFVWYNTTGFKVTTYVLATKSLDYLLYLHPDLKSYIVHSRPDMTILSTTEYDSLSGISISQTEVNKILERYTSKVDYFDNKYESYLSDFYQQLGRPFVVQSEGYNTQGMPGFMLSTTSPKYHLSQYSSLGFPLDNALNSDGEYSKYQAMDKADLESVLNNFRTEMEISKLSEMKQEDTDKTNKKITVGNFYNADKNLDGKYSDGDLDLFDASNLRDMIGNTENVNELTTSKDFLRMSIQGSIISGIYEDGITWGELSGYTVESNKSTAPTSSNAVIEVKTITTEGKPFENTQASIQCIYKGNEFRIKLNEYSLYDAFLSKYKCNGQSYTYESLKLESDQRDSNFGLDSTVVVVIEPVTCDYARPSFFTNGHSDSEYAELWGKYWKEVKSSKTKYNGFFFSLKDRMYWFSDSRTNKISTTNTEGYKGIIGYRYSVCGSIDKRTTMKDSYRPDEKYNIGLVLNTIPADGLAFHQTYSQNAGQRLMNVLMVNKEPYAEVNSVELGGVNTYRPNHYNATYGFGDSIKTSGLGYMPTGYLWNKTSGLNEGVHGGLALVYYISKESSKTSRILDPFPVVSVRHINQTAIEEKSDENVLMRDTQTWTLPTALGLAIEHDLSVASFIAETGTPAYALGYSKLASVPSEDSLISYQGTYEKFNSVRDYIKIVTSIDRSVVLRFGNYNNTDEFYKIRVKLINSLDQTTYNYNGISITTLSIKDITEGLKDFPGIYSLIKKAHTGDTEAQNEIYKVLQNNIISKYSKYDIKIPLVPNSSMIGKSTSNTGDTLWAVPAKPLTTMGGNLEYEDGEVMSTNIDSSNNLLGVLEEYRENKEGWESAKNSTSGKANELSYFGGTSSITINTLTHPLYRVPTTMEYSKAPGFVWDNNLVIDTFYSKTLFYTGINFSLDRQQGSNKEGTHLSKVSTGSLADWKDYWNIFYKFNTTRKTYMPSVKVYRDYIDTLMDVTTFSGGLVSQVNTNSQSEQITYRKVLTAIKSSNNLGNSLWQYMINPEKSLLLKSLSGKNSLSSIYNENWFNSMKDDVGSITSINSLQSKPSAYWLNSEFEIDTIGTPLVRQNMFFNITPTIGGSDDPFDDLMNGAGLGSGSGSGTTHSNITAIGRSFNTVWVPDLGNVTPDLETGNYSSGSLTATKSKSATVYSKDMFTNYDETITSISIAYNPVMSALEGWTYRVSDDKDLTETYTGENNAFNLPSTYQKVDSSSESSATTQNKKTAMLSGVNNILDMPGEILSYKELNSKGSSGKSADTDSDTRNMIKYTELDGWDPLKSGQFSNSDSNFASGDVLSKDSNYTVQITDSSNSNTGYITLNVGAMLNYGDLGTFDVYYASKTSNGVIDLSVKVEIAEDEVEAFEYRDLFSSSYSILDKKVSKLRELKAPFKNNQDLTAYSVKNGVSEDSKYLKTIKVNVDSANNIILGKDGEEIFNDLGNTKYQLFISELSNNIANVKSDMSTIKNGYSLYYVNVWLEPKLKVSIPSNPGTNSNSVIRADELVSAQTVTLPKNTITISASKRSASNCSYYSDGCSLSSRWTYVGAQIMNNAKGVSTQLKSPITKSDAFTILGTGNTNKTFRMRWLGETGDGSLSSSVTYSDFINGKLSVTDNSAYVTQAVSGNLSNGESKLIGTDAIAVFLTHRSMLSNGTFIKSPALASYMNNTTENKKYLGLMNETGTPIESAYRATEVGRTSGSRYGYSNTGGNSTITFNTGTLSVGFTSAYDIKVDYSYRDSYSGTWYYDWDWEWTGEYDEKGNKIYDWYRNDYYHSSHSNSYSNDSSRISVSVNGSTVNKSISIEGTYVANNQPNTLPLDNKLSTIKSNLQMYDKGVSYYVGKQIKFYPTYIMRADYNENAYESGVKYSGASTVGNREKVWVLGAKERTLDVYDYHRIELISGGGTTISGAWSTDKKDSDLLDRTGLPTIKAGAAIKALPSAAIYSITSVVYLQDPNFVGTGERSLVIAENKKALNQHTYLVNKIASMGNNDRASGSYSFMYSNIPGSYDNDLTARGILNFKTEFKNIINGVENSFTDAQTAKSLEQTRLKMLNSSSSIGQTSINGYYFNKYYTGKDYTGSDYNGGSSRNYLVQTDTQGVVGSLNKNIVLNNKDTGSISTAITDIDKLYSENLDRYDNILEQGSGTNSWYKEDYEGIIEVTLKTSVTVYLESDYSIIWGNLSDWTDSDPVRVYKESRPFASTPSTDVLNINNSNPGIHSNISSTNTGIGYGLMTDNITLDGNDYGRLCLLWSPYMFNIRGNIYDETSN